MFLFSSAQYYAWQSITRGASAADGQIPYKCTAELDAGQDFRAAWMEAADRYIWR